MTKRIHVAVGVILNADGQILVARRADTQHLGGLWEFPGGKLEPGETVQQALQRELREELAIEVLGQRPLCRIEHTYPGKAVLLDVWIVDSFDGTPVGMEQQPLRWLDVDQLKPEEFPAANRLIIRRLRLPDFVAIVDAKTWPSKPLHTSRNTLIRLRWADKKNYSNYLDCALNMLAEKRLQAHAAVLDLDVSLIDHNGTASQTLLTRAEALAGFHISSTTLREITQRPVPDHFLLGASCHNEAELRLAASLDCDYVLLSPVQATASHPEAQPLGWQQFENLAAASPVPVYALGGMRPGDLEKAQSMGAKGIAGITLSAALL